MHRNTIYVNMVELLFSKYYTDLMSFPSQLPTYHSLRLLTFLAWGVTAKLARISLSFFAASQIDSFLPKIFTTSAYDFISLSYPSKIFFFCGPFSKVIIKFITVLFLFHVLAFWSRGRWISAPWPGTQSVHPAPEDEVSPAGPEVSIKGSAPWLLCGTSQSPVSPSLPFGAIIK